MIIAIPTNDRKNIAVRTGRAKEFAIYKIENKEVKDVKYLTNTHKHDHVHHHGDGHGHNHGKHSHRELIELLKGIDIFLVGHIGKYLKNEVIEADIKYKMVKRESLKDIIDTYLNDI